MSARRFKRPKNGSFAHYCGECAKWAPVEHEYGEGYGMCDYHIPPAGKYSLAYMLTSVWKDQYEGACPLFEKGGK